MKRRIIHIDAEKCNGCGLCVAACHEGAIALVDGKAKLMRDDYCDGLGDCLPACPVDAITFTEREAAAYDAAAVEANKAMKLKAAKVAKSEKLSCGCSSTEERVFSHYDCDDDRGTRKAQSKSNSAKPEKLPCGCPSSEARVFSHDACEAGAEHRQPEMRDTAVRHSCLSQFPVQIKLVSPNAAFLDGCDLLIAADCTAFAYNGFHEDFIRGRITLVGCPKLDAVDYAEKLAEILIANDINSLTVVRMEVPCCGGLVESVKSALKESGKIIPWQVVTITRDGRITGR